MTAENRRTGLPIVEDTPEEGGRFADGFRILTLITIVLLVVSTIINAIGILR